MLFILWLVRLALLCYAAALTRLLSGRVDALARAAWTAGFVLLTLHVLAAFAAVHHWSHARAWEHTAAETQATLGLALGAGVYFNYVFVLLWGIDVVWWWTSAATYRVRSRWLTLAVHGYLAFVVFNSVVVFESGPLRWLGLLATLGLGVVWWTHRAR